jgi:hypothetical protein
VRNIIFPSTVGIAVRVIRNGLEVSDRPEASDVTVLPKLAGTKTRRMVTVRDDSGPDDQTQTRRRHGVNVWAEDAVTAEALALLCMAILRSCADGKPVTHTDEFSGPYEVTEDPPYMVGDDELAHYFFTFRMSARGADFLNPPVLPAGIAATGH